MLEKCLPRQVFFVLFIRSFLTATTMMIYNAILVADNDLLHLISFCHRIVQAMNKRKTISQRPMGSISTQLTCTHVYTEGNHSGISQSNNFFHHFHIVHMVEYSPVWDAQKESDPEGTEGNIAIWFFNRIKWICLCLKHKFRWTLNTNRLSKWKQ